MKFANQRPLPFSARRIVIRTAAPTVAAVARPRQAIDANTFAARRIRHAIELAGSCMLIALFVVLALFA